MASAHAAQVQAALQSASESTQAQSVPTQVPQVMAAAPSQIRLTNFDPDDTPFTTVVWIDNITRIQQELEISDTLIVLKAGSALRG